MPRDYLAANRVGSDSLIPDTFTDGEVKLGNISMDSPVFIVGMSRSGTTLLSRMLDAHSEIAIFPETWLYVVLDHLGCIEKFSSPWQTALFFREVWKSLGSYKDSAARVLAKVAAEEAKYVGPTAVVLEKLGQAYATERHARIWGEKTPGHALWLREIRDLFPQARILSMVRDPRDVVVSYDDRWGQSRRDTEYVTSTAALLKHFLAHLLHRPGFPPDQIHWVKYEALTAQPQTELERVCTFLGVEFEPRMLMFYRRHQDVGSEMTDGHHHDLLSKPATTEKIGRYREALTPAQIALVERLLRDEMRVLGYPLSENEGQMLTPAEERSFEKAQDDYRQMASGVIRNRFRRRGRLKLMAYKIFGRTLGLVPSWRVATTARDWQILSEKPSGPGEM